MASWAILQVDQACLEHSTALGSALEGIGGSARRRALEKDNTHGPILPGVHPRIHISELQPAGRQEVARRRKPRGMKHFSLSGAPPEETAMPRRTRYYFERSGICRRRPAAPGGAMDDREPL